MEELSKPEELSREQALWTINTYYNALYGTGMDYYDSSAVNKELVGLNNNPMIPTYDSLRESVATYKESAEQLQAYSEFMKVWDSVYKKTLENKVALLAFDKYEYCVNISNPKEYQEKAYLDDVKRVKKFFQKFNYKQEFRNAVSNMVTTDTYFCWLRDSSGSFDETEIDLSDDYSVKRAEMYALQMMPQDKCRISGRNPYGMLWDFDFNYFNEVDTNIENYDPSLVKLFNESKSKGVIKSFVNNNDDQKKTNGYKGSTDGYVRVNMDNGAWVFKYDSSNFNAVPPFTSLLKSVFNNDVVERMQKDKDMIGAYMVITGEMETRKEDNNKDPLKIDDKRMGTFLKLARKALANEKIKTVPFPLQEIKSYQFQDYNQSMFKNQLKNSAGQGMNASDIVYSSEKLGEFAEKCALELDFHEIADKLYPQFENFLNFYVNKKTKKYKFKFKLKGSNLSFMRKDAIDYQLKLADKGIQVPPKVWGSLYGYESDEFEALMMEAKYSNMQDLTFLLLNANTTAQDGNAEVGNPTKSIDDLSDGGSTSHEYD